jgi:hypothetical protein
MTVESKMEAVRPEITGKGSAVRTPMTLEEFVRIFALPPIVPVKRCCEILACGHSKYYVLGAERKIRIVSAPGGRSGSPVEDLHKLCVEALLPSTAA